MTRGGAEHIETRIGPDPLRRVVLGILALYLAPAVLVVLLISGLGMACCALLRLTAGGPGQADGRPRRDAARHAVAAPHVLEVVRSRSPGR